MKVIFLTSALRRVLFCGTFHSRPAGCLKSTLEQLENCFENIYSLFKDANNRALKYYTKHYFKGDTGKCNFNMSKTSAVFPLALRVDGVTMCYHDASVFEKKSEHSISPQANMEMTRHTLSPNTGKLYLSPLPWVGSACASIVKHAPPIPPHPSPHP